jgi:hypothetical protein
MRCQSLGWAPVDQFISPFRRPKSTGENEHENLGSFPLISQSAQHSLSLIDNDQVVFVGCYEGEHTELIRIDGKKLGRDDC